ncbi:DUF2934 domain-containing protein [Candidatus Nitrotoga fabula]|uniref:DUF2934 domain-containing protein n=1 Tax=Candidatus Nitrotoga fabula TaxID=2182327 RepID=A0A916BE06_9PROT|nr:DUF2934 domain-containing protein [Candidatus Nitrotoga fabula]CAE6723912.1 conserved hypothetical protein [Candidatus Nitrotoga fabula]
MNPTRTKRKAAINPTGISSFDPDLQSNNEKWRSRIAESAYYMAEARGFLPGHELDDWLAAESHEVLQQQL